MENSQHLTQEDTFAGNSPEAKHINRAIAKFARVDSNVIFFGDSGTGKEFTARQIHAASIRRSRPFVVLNCSALGDTINKEDLLGQESRDEGTIKRTIGMFEKANGGSLFLDNLKDMPADFQFEFLRIIQEKKFRRIGGIENISLDLRIMSALKQDLEEDYDFGDFRKELYFQLKSLTISLPTLLERRQDIPELFLYFLKKYCNENELEIPAVPAEIFESILEYEWKGNIRELRSCVENTVMMSPNGELSTSYLPFEIKRHPLDSLEVKDLTGVISEVETYLIRKALSKFAGNQVKAAKLLGIPEATLRFKMKKYAILRN